MTLRDDMSTLQYEISAWANETFPDSAMPGVMAHLIEEVEELFEATQSAEEAAKRNDDDPDMYAVKVDEVADECADVMHLLFQVADMYGFDLLAATRLKLKVNKARTWGKPDNNGVVRHVEASI